MHLSSRFLLIFIFLHTSSISSATQPTPSHFSNCAPSPYTCGKTTFNISYPFLSDSRATYCGSPDYSINCTNMNTTLAITISDHSYQITTIDYNNRAINVVNTDFMSASLCPAQFSNTTINLDLFEYSDRDRNITVYTNCSTPSLPVPNIVDYPCLDMRGPAYFRLDNGSMDDLFGKCGSVVNVPVGQETAENLVNGRLRFDHALQQGFFLTWTAGSDWCDGCMASGGYCGYNSTNVGQHLCFCSGGSSIDSCDSRGGGVNSRKIVIGVSCGLGGLFIVAICFYCCRNKLKQNLSKTKVPIQSVSSSKSHSNKDTEAINFNYSTPHLFSYEELVEATNSFDPSAELGDGGYGVVYKGYI